MPRGASPAIVLASALAVAAVTAVSAQPPFRSGVDLVVVDVGVVDRDGHPVRGLGPADFAVAVDGKPRRVVSAEYVSSGAAETPGRGEAASGRAARQTAPRRSSTNAEAGGPVGPAARVILLVVDELHIATGGGKAVMRAAGRFLDRLGPSDRVGLAVVPGGSPSVEFTVNHAVVREALGRVVGRATRAVRANTVTLTEAYAFLSDDVQLWQDVVERECARDLQREACIVTLENDARRIVQETESNAIRSLRAIGGLVTALDRLEGPKTIVLLSQGLPLGDLPRFQGEFNSEAGAIARTAARARVTLFSLRIDATAEYYDVTVDGTSLTIFNDANLLRAGLDRITDLTRGTMLNVVGSGDLAFERVAREISGHYLVGVEPVPGDRDGRPHRIAVQVGRPGVTVRARREFTLAEPAVPVAVKPRDEMSRLLRTFDTPAELPLAVATYLVRDRDSGRLRVIVAAEIDRDRTTSDEVAVGYLLRDAEDRVAGASGDVVELAPADRSLPSPLVFSAALLVAPGRYTLRLAAVDRQGRRGVVEHPITAVTTTVGGLEFSDLLVASETTGPGSRTRLSVTGAVRDVLPALLEVYAPGRAALDRLSIDIELASDDDSPAIQSAPAKVTGARAGQSAVVAAEASLPLKLLPPGDYVARAVIRRDTQVVARIVEAIRIVRFSAPAASSASLSPAAQLAETVIEPFRNEDLLDAAVVGHFLDRALAAGVADPGPGVAGAVAAAKAGRFDEAAREIGNAGGVTAAFIRGLAAFSRRDLDAAAVQFRAAIAAASEFFPAVVYLGACYAAGGHYGDAAGAWQMALIAEGDQPVLFRLIADALLRAGDAEGARGILLEAALVWPDEESFTRRLAVAHLAAGREDEAASALTAYLDRRPDDPDALLLAIGIVYSARLDGRSIDSPERDYERAAGWARQYASSGGGRQPLVAQWIRYLESKKR